MGKPVQTATPSRKNLRQRKSQHSHNHRTRRNRKRRSQFNSKMCGHGCHTCAFRLHSSLRHSVRNQTATTSRSIQAGPTRQILNRQRTCTFRTHAFQHGGMSNRLRHQRRKTNSHSGNRQTFPNLRMPKLQPPILQRKTKRTNLQLPPKPAAPRNIRHKTAVALKTYKSASEAACFLPFSCSLGFCRVTCSTKRQKSHIV